MYSNEVILVYPTNIYEGKKYGSVGLRMWPFSKIVSPYVVLRNLRTVFEVPSRKEESFWFMLES